MKKRWKSLIAMSMMACTAIGITIGLELNKNETQEMKIVKTNYDVIVMNGEPEGVAAAVSAARNGSTVLLIEERDGLGGLMTYGALNYLDIPQNEKGTVTTEGIFREWWSMVGGESTTTVDVDVAKEKFLELVNNEPNITLKLNSKIKEVKVENKNITGITLEDGVVYTAERYIDTTADADIAAKAGVTYTTGQQDIGVDRKMAVTLMIHLKNVDWDKVKKAGKDGLFGGAEVTNRAAWGFPNVLDGYQETEENTQVRGLNIGRTKDEEIYINALQIFYVDGLDKNGKVAAIEEGKRETDSFVKWLKKEFPGFENAEIVAYPDELYVRETRHINSLYRLTIADVWESAEKYDTIAYGSYPVDVQAMEKGNYGNVITKANQYAIPYRSIVPYEIDNLLVASKASGYDSLAAGSARIIPTGMAVAEAAGYIADHSIDINMSLKDIAENKEEIVNIQEGLEEQGMYLKPLKEGTKYPYEGDAIYPELKILYSYEMIAGGYDNDFKLDEQMGELSYARLIKNGYEKVNIEKLEEKKDLFLKYETDLAENKPLTKKRLIELTKEITGKEIVINVKGEKVTKRDIYPIIAKEIEPFVEEYKIKNEN